jgi:hypothetical protein
MRIDLLHPWYTVPLLVLGWALLIYGALRLLGAVGASRSKRGAVGTLILVLGAVGVAHGCGMIP